MLNYKNQTWVREREKVGVFRRKTILAVVLDSKWRIFKNLTQYSKSYKMIGKVSHLKITVRTIA